MKCFCDIDYNLLTSIIVLGIALITLFVSYRAIRYQIISLINVQLADKAKQCNSNLDPKDLSKPPKNNDKVSGTVSSINSAEEILNYHAYIEKSIFIRGFDLQSLIDQFYLQLHTTIRVFLQKGRLYDADIENRDNREQIEIFKEQYKRSIEFLSISIKKDKDKFFEKLHSYSLLRNRNQEIINMKKSKIGYLVITSAIVWGSVIIGCALVLKGTPYYKEVNYILIGGVVFHLLFIWTPLGNQFRIKNEEK